MNPRQRVIAALNHEEPDMVPIDLGGNQSGIHMKAYKNLLNYLDIEDNDIRYSDFIQQLAYPCEELLQRLDVDIRWLRTPSSLIPERFTPQAEGKYQGVFDQFGVFWGDSAEKDVEDILFYDPCIHPLSDATTVQEIVQYDWPDGTDKSPLDGLRENAKKLRETTKYAIAAPPLGCIYEYTTFLFGFEKALRFLRMRPELIVAAMEELERYWTDYATTYLNEVKFGDEHYVDIVAVNGDLAAQTGPIMNVDNIYSRIIKPIERRFAKKIHELAQVKVNYHCCGSVARFIPHFAEIGYDAVNPVQVAAYDMEPCSLKERFGKIISFWGGLCDTQHTLPFGSPEQVRSEVLHNMACLRPGGGYVASNIHNVTAEVPPLNVVAMFDASREFRRHQ
ncbi:MAG: uroporphyrinogen decarboxylase family protein [Promethearchaeati archaeon SRVP18_Atabeyarchaeia-1]